MRRAKITIRVTIFAIALFFLIGHMIFLFGDEVMSVKRWDSFNMSSF